MISRRRACVVAASIAAAIASFAPAARATRPAGCVSSRHAVAYYAGGKAIMPPPRMLVPCATQTGFFTGETGIGVTKPGTVWFSAADWEWALAVTRDEGAHWRAFTVPGPQAYPGCNFAGSAYTCNTSESSKYNTVADAYLYVDPRTSRIFWSKTYGEAECSSLSLSADDGATWEAVPQFTCPGGDYEKIAAGPPPAGGAAPSGYPDVVYGCANGPAPTFVVGPGRVCWKSLDGGLTWSAAGAPVPSPEAPGCLQFQEPQRVGPDGTLYLPLNCSLTGSNPAGLVRVAISHDEGQTWSYAQVPTADTGVGAGPIGGVSLAVDGAGVVYVVWTGTDNKVYLAESKDQGQNWTGPLAVGQPGINQYGPAGSVDTPTHAPQVAAGGAGQIAIAYYGTPGTDASRLNAYLTESFDASAPRPVFYSAQLNDSAHPLYFPVKSGTLPRNDYLGVTVAPDGTPWGAFVKLRSDTPDSQGYIQSTGYAGRLVPARLIAPVRPRPRPRRRACAPPTGNLSGARLGVVTLGDPRAAVRRRFAVFSTHGRLHMDYVCLKGIGIRIGYVSERAALILTANRFYALDGVRPGSSLAAARARLRLGAGIRLGPNTWYVASRPVANGVLKVNRGRVAEIGIALRSETSTPARARAFLSGFD